MRDQGVHENTDLKPRNRVNRALELTSMSDCNGATKVILNFIWHPTSTIRFSFGGTYCRMDAASLEIFQGRMTKVIRKFQTLSY